MSGGYNPPPNPLPIGMGGTGSQIGPVLASRAIASTLPAAAANAGQIFIVTDALAPALGVTVVGGGAVTVAVWSNGANWVVM